MQEIDIYDDDSFSEDSFDEEDLHLNDIKLEEDEEQNGGATRKARSAPAAHGAIEITKAPASAPTSSQAPPSVHVTTPPVSEIPPSKKGDEESDDDAETVSSEGSEGSTIDALSSDPLFLVLTQFLSHSRKNCNIVDALMKIHKDLNKIVYLLEHK